MIYTQFDMIIKGRFILKWGDNEIQDITNIKVNYKVDQTTLKTVQGKSYIVDGSHEVDATIDLLASDVPSLALLLPQYFVPDGGKLSTGETVQDAQGAIDINPAVCAEDTIHNHFDIISCGVPGQVLRIVNARTQIAGVTNDDKTRMVSVQIIGEAAEGEATIQFFRQGNVNTVS